MYITGGVIAVSAILPVLLSIAIITEGTNLELFTVVSFLGIFTFGGAVAAISGLGNLLYRYLSR